MFPLSVFPVTSLASSVVTTVWVGVFVITFFNLRLGWVLSGLVVPGYLVPLLILKPWAAGVVLIEGVLTYWVIWLFSEYFSGLGKWSNLFGRDRFFALLLVSVAVRIVMDVWLLPETGAFFNDWLGIQFDYRNNLHSFGLIIVALVANQFWKTGLIRGIVPMLVTLGVTFLIVRYGLMELTNFSISGISYLYEDVASSMLASPKAYIILIVTALIASRMNLHYGWDFNGILIPALLALQWYQPSKILITFAESFVIYFLAIWILRMPVLQQMSIEGGRKLLLFFNVSFCYKLVLGYLLLWFLPEYKSTDFFAFGYLLSTLIAIKMHDKGIAARLTRATVQTSLVGVVVASIMGLLLTFLPSFWSWSIPQDLSASQSDTVDAKERLIQLFRQDKVAMYQVRKPMVDVILPQEFDDFSQGIHRLFSYVREHKESVLIEARYLLGLANYTISETDQGLLYLREKNPKHGWGIYVIRLDATNQLAIEVPAPLDEVGTAEAGIAVFNLTNARALSIGGSLRHANPDGSADVLRNYQTAFNIFHRELIRHDVLQIRGYEEGIFAMRSLHSINAKSKLKTISSGLWIQDGLPEALNLKEIKEIIGDFSISWQQSPVDKINQQTNHAGYAELVLVKADLRKLQSQLLLSDRNTIDSAQNPVFTADIQKWILGRKSNIAKSGTNLYRQPKQEELLFFDREVLSPMLHLINQQQKLQAWSNENTDVLRVLDAAASVIGYQVSRYHSSTSGQEYLVVSERDDSVRRRYWGTFVFRMTQGQGFTVQVPRPVFEANTFEVGVVLFDLLHADALLIAGADPNANTDHSANMLDINNLASMFNLVNQVILREAGDRNVLVLQSRAFGLRPDRAMPGSDALLSFDNGSNSEETLTPLAKILAETVHSLGLEYDFVDGSPATAGYEVSNIPQSKYLQQSRNKEFGILWLSTVSRWSFQQQNSNRIQHVLFHAIGISNKENSLPHYLSMADGSVPSQTIPHGLRQSLHDYLETKNAVSLYRAYSQYPAYRIERLLDHDSQRAFLLLYQREDNRIALVVNLSAYDLSRTITLFQYDDPSEIKHYIDSGAAWLEVGKDS